MKHLMLLGFVIINFAMHSAHGAARQSGTRVPAPVALLALASFAHSVHAVAQRLVGPQAPSEELVLLREIKKHVVSQEDARIARAQKRAAMFAQHAAQVNQQELDQQTSAAYELGCINEAVRNTQARTAELNALAAQIEQENKALKKAIEGNRRRCRCWPFC